MRRAPCLAIVLCCLVAGTVAQAEPLRLDFSPSPLADVLSRSQAQVVPANVPRCAAAPKVDGKLDDAAWTSAAAIQVSKGTTHSPAARARVCFDDAALYIAVECEHHPGREPVGQTRERHGRVWADDCVEIWIDTSLTGSAVHQFVVNAAGSIYDGSSADGPNYNPQWAHAVERGKDRWCVEAAIPKAALGLAQWRPRLAFNVGRNGPGLGARCWAGDYGATDRGALALQGVQEAAAETAKATGGPSLKMTIARPSARPQDRYVEARLDIPPLREKATVTAKLFADSDAKPVAEAKAAPTQSQGTLLADLRTLGLDKAKLVVELADATKVLARAEAAVSAQKAETALGPGQRIPVKLDLPAGIDAVTAWPVSFGVPFPAGALWDVNTLRLVDANGKEIPCQKEVTGWWAKDGAIKWVRFDALVSSKDGCFVEVAASTSPAVALKVTEQGGKVVVDTGAARYVLGKGASPVEEVWVGQKRIAASAGTRDLYVVDQKGRQASASADGETIEVEARGPVAACVRFEGFYRTSDGDPLARHITRVEAFAGQPFAKVTHTLVLARDSNEVWFKDIGWEFAVETGADAKALFGVSRDEWGKLLAQPLDGLRSVYMLQDQHYYFAHNTNHFVAAKEDATGKTAKVLEGEECGDWAAVGGSAGGLAVACREAARQHPKEFEVRRDRFILRLFSNRAGEELDFRAATLAKKWDLPTWYDKTVPQSYKKPIEDVLKKVSAYESNAIGWSKTHELMISPLAATTTSKQAARLARLHSAPVLAIADPAWICASEAMGAIHPKDTARFPEAEQAIEAAVRYWESRVPEWGDYGFVDYYAGPMLSYQGKYPEQYRYRFATYTLRPDLWLLYARSGDRVIGEFAMGTNRAFSDGNMIHWDGPRKTRGLFIHGSGTDIPPGAANTGMLPFYWLDIPTMHISSASNLNCYAWDYYLTGFRRARDIMLEYADGVKRTWSPAQAKRDQRALALMRMLVQSYAFTWDPALRALAEATMDTVWKPDSETGLFQKRSTYDNEERNTMYKTQVDVRGLIEAWGILGEQRYYDCALKVARYWWQEHLVDWPLFYCNPVGVVGSFLYRQTGDPRYAQGLAVQVRHAASAYDPEKKEISGVGGAEKTTFLFEGVAYAGDVLTRLAADKGPVASWIAYEDFGFPSSMIVRKSGGKAGQLDVHPPRDVRIASAGKSAESLPWVVKGSYTKQSVQIPANAATGEYEIAPKDFGLHGAVADCKMPLVLYAPGYWRPSPAQAPNVRYYFKLPEGSKDAQIVFEGSARLFDPQGQSWRNGEAQHGAVDLPPDKPGLWSFLPVDNQLVKARNFPPFFAAESPESYFEPKKIAWQREPLPGPTSKPAKTGFVEGAIAGKNNQALYIGKPSFKLPLGQPHPSGDGNQFFPHKQGTLEFWFKPCWGTVEMPTGSKCLSRLYVPSGKQSYTLYYYMKPRNRDPSLDFIQSHILEGYFQSEGPSRSVSLRAWRRTVFAANEWVHIAWVWGQRDGVIPNTIGYHTKPQKEVLLMEIYVNGHKGQSYNYRWYKNLPVETPHTLEIGDLEAAVDELRISDVQRYTADFTPPSREQEFKLDAHTRALFHFNGTSDGESHGQKGPVVTGR